MADQAVTEVLSSAIARLYTLHRQHHDLSSTAVLVYINRAQQGPRGNEYERLLVDWFHENLEANERARLDVLLDSIAAELMARGVRQVGGWLRPF